MLLEEIRTRIDAEWTERSLGTNWPRLEDVLVAILRCNELSHEQQTTLIKEAIDAHTRRGHFMGSY